MNLRAPLGLYVHIPFCSVKCFYCDFVAFSGKSGQADRYLDSLEREAACYDGVFPDTLYVGGGTPSELSAEQITRLLSILSDQFGPVSGWRETTFEVNPESAEEGKFEALRSGGVGRISIGLQTPDDSLLKSIGRKHDYAQFVKTYLAARKTGHALSVDLMCALPGQSVKNFKAGLDKVLQLEPEHISLYALSVEDRTLFMKRAVIPDEDSGREMLEAAYERLERAGFEQYEISNFARPGHASAHNENYWKNGSYVGLGCGAAGHLRGVRYQNEDVLARYSAKADAGVRPLADEERLTGKEKIGESIWLGLRRLEGLVLSPEMQSSFRREIEELTERGLLRLRGGCSDSLPKLSLTRSGVFLANEVFREFIAPFEGAEL